MLLEELALESLELEEFDSESLELEELDFESLKLEVPDSESLELEEFFLLTDEELADLSSLDLELDEL